MSASCICWSLSSVMECTMSCVYFSGGEWSEFTVDWRRSGGYRKYIHFDTMRVPLCRLSVYSHVMKRLTCYLTCFQRWRDHGNRARPRFRCEGYAVNEIISTGFYSQRASDVELWYFLFILAKTNCWTKSRGFGDLKRRYWVMWRRCKRLHEYATITHEIWIALSDAYMYMSLGQGTLQWRQIMMTSSNGSFFRVTHPLWGMFLWCPISC